MHLHRNSGYKGLIRGGSFRTAVAVGVDGARYLVGFGLLEFVVPGIDVDSVVYRPLT